MGDQTYSEIAEPEKRPNLIARQVVSYRVAELLGTKVLVPEIFSKAHDGSLLGVTGQAKGNAIKPYAMDSLRGDDPLTIITTWLGPPTNMKRLEILIIQIYSCLSVSIIEGYNHDRGTGQPFTLDSGCMMLDFSFVAVESNPGLVGSSISLDVHSRSGSIGEPYALIRSREQNLNIRGNLTYFEIDAQATVHYSLKTI